MDKQLHIIVVGNEKGGAGKTTSSMHLIMSLLHLGFKVSSIDVDFRQKSLSRYLENRVSYAKNHNLSLYMPDHFTLDESQDKDADLEKLQKFIENQKKGEIDFLIIDTPGSNTAISTYAHSLADTIITPINDSFLDLDVIAKIEADSLKIIKPSFYAQAIWEQKMAKAKASAGEINWLVVRNRVSSIDAKNKQRMSDVLHRLASRVGFKVLLGFNERVIYRELFLHGLTLLDIKPGMNDVSFSTSHIAAKQELNNLLRSLDIAKINEALLRR